MKCPQCHSENPPDSRFCRKCATPLLSEEELALSQTKTLLHPPHSLERGSTVSNRYEVIEELGKGGMGRVYKVFDKKIKEVVALKLIKPEISTDEKTIERFNNELRLARKISHRNVCRMYDLGEEGNSHFITMEYVPGEDLKRFIKRSGQLTVGKSVSLARQVCEGLAEAHHLGVIHRDLKPQNIMIDTEGNARIMDFGIARFLESEGLTTQGVMIGTPEYMSPEQAEMEDVDQRTDIYSLGVILFEMLTGSVPFKGKTLLSIAMKHKTEAPPDPQKLNTQIPEDLSRLIHKCLEKDRQKRYQNVEELLSDLQQMEKGLPTTEKVESKTKSQTSREITVTFNARKFMIPLLILIFAVAAFLLVRYIVPRGGESISTQGKSGRERGVIDRPQQEERIREPSEGEKSGLTAAPAVTKLFADRLEGFVDTSKYSEEVQLFGNILGLLSPEVLKHLEKQDKEDIERFIKSIEGKLPEKGPHVGMIQDIRNKITEGKKFQEQGKKDEAKKSYLKSQTQMRDLLAVVKEKEEADQMLAAMKNTKQSASLSLGFEEKNLLFRVAEKREEDAANAYENNDFSGAKTLYKILERIYKLSIQGGDEKESFALLQEYVKNTKNKAAVIGSGAQAGWFFDRAQEEEKKARSHFDSKDYQNAVSSLIQVAFLYEKAIEKAQENK
jgi:serine/threonine protein kinase